MFRPLDSYVWDFWTADDGERHHLFFLYASVALGDPDARHERASVGHAVSDDLTTWTRIQDALVRSDPPAFDDTATWTGSVVRRPDGTWFLFYTGLTFTENGENRQAIGCATSPDLIEWTKLPGPLLQADPRWYEVGGDGWSGEHFRDPWVFADPGGDGWHMILTARAGTGPVDDRGVVGHARSADLVTWELLAPLSEPGQGFGQLEVCQVFELDGQHLLTFSCLGPELSAGRRRNGSAGGVWVARGESALGPWDIAGAQQLTDASLYVGKVVRDRAGKPWFLAFANEGPDGRFVGGIIDPRPVGLVDGRVVLLDADR